MKLKWPQSEIEVTSKWHRSEIEVTSKFNHLILKPLVCTDLANVWDCLNCANCLLPCWDRSRIHVFTRTCACVCAWHISTSFLGTCQWIWKKEVSHENTLLDYILRVKRQGFCCLVRRMYHMFKITKVRFLSLATGKGIPENNKNLTSVLCW